MHNSDYETLADALLELLDAAKRTRTLIRLFYAGRALVEPMIRCPTGCSMSPQPKGPAAVKRWIEPSLSVC